MSARYMAIGHRGTVLHGLERPRRDLLRRLGRKSCRRVFRDKADGRTVHTGYIVAGEWFELYQVTPWERGES